MPMKETKGDKIFNAINICFLGLMALIVLYPLYFIIIGLSSLLWILSVYLLPKELDTKG